jgi:hypothetical protein
VGSTVPVTLLTVKPVIGTPVAILESVKLYIEEPFQQRRWPNQYEMRVWNTYLEFQLGNPFS